MKCHAHSKCTGRLFEYGFDGCEQLKVIIHQPVLEILQINLYAVLKFMIM